MVRDAETLTHEAEEAAADAGLRYVTDAQPGIHRRRRGGSKNTFAYLDANGAPIRDPEALQRIRLLAVPPAWDDVWIAPARNAHIQATGRDARGRKQYRYHVRWREVRDESKFDSLIAFGTALPAIRKRVKRDLALRGLPREKVLATVVRLLDLTAMRIGNEEYARTNGSHGLTTLRDDHASFGRGKVRFTFKGKSSKQHAIEVHDAQLSRIVRRCRDVPGEELFQYLDDCGEHHGVDSGAVNSYIREALGDTFGTKHFRTWDATLLAAVTLREAGPGATRAETAARVKHALEVTSTFLGNTVAVCRKSYVHPAILEAYGAGRVLGAPSSAPRHAGLEPVESSLLAFLKSEAAAATKHARADRPSKRHSRAA